MPAIVLLQGVLYERNKRASFGINGDIPSMRQSVIALYVKISAQDAKINHDFVIMKQPIAALGSKIT